MSRYQVNKQPAYILHTRKYKETSLLLDFFTQDIGKVSIIAKGVRKKKSTTAAALQAFTLLEISFRGNKDLKTLTHVDMLQPNFFPKGVALYSGFYLNELVYEFLPYYDPHPDVFVHYVHSLNQILKNSDIEVTLRLFEMNLMRSIGYALPLTVDFRNNKPIKAGSLYDYEMARGPLENAHGWLSGNTLLALQRQQLQDAQCLKEAKQLLRRVIDFHLHGRELKSRAMFAQVVQQLRVKV